MYHTWCGKLFIAMILLIGLAVPAMASSFTDVSESDWFYDELDLMVERGIVSGYEDGTFRPSNSVSMGEVSKMLYVYNQNKTLENGSSHWADNYANAVYALTWVEHVPEDLDASATRIQVCEMVLNSLGFLEDPSYLDCPFIDTDNLAASTLYDMGIINGSLEAEGWMLRGDEAITRAEFCAILDRVAKYMDTEYTISDFRYQMPQVTIPQAPEITYDYFYNAFLYMMVVKQDELVMTFYNTSGDALWEEQGGYDLANRAFADVQNEYHELGAFYDTIGQKWESTDSTVVWTITISNDDFTISEIYGYETAFLLGVPSYAQQIYDAGMVTAQMSDYEIAKYLYQYMALNFAYDTTLHPISFNGYGMLYNNLGVCQGYVSVYNVLCKQFGLEIMGKSGTAGGEAHIWSYANLDGTWLYIDPTWGDPIPNGNIADMDYFAVDRTQLEQTHTFED